MFQRRKSPTSDVEIIEGLNSGYPGRGRMEYLLFEKFAYLVKQVGQRKFHLSEDDAQSAYGDAIISLIKHLTAGSFKQDSSIKTFLFRVFSNRCVDLIRKSSSNRDKGEWLSEFPNIGDSVRDVLSRIIEHEEVDRIKHMLVELGESCQKILWAWGQGHNLEEIAVLAGLSDAASAKSRKYKCLMRLRALQEKKGSRI